VLATLSRRDALIAELLAGERRIALAGPAPFIGALEHPRERETDRSSATVRVKCQPALDS
jgi:hypothetical protein